MAMPPPPACAFASDNAAGAHPLVLDALVQANSGHALAYGDDDWTRRCEAQFSALFDRSVTVLLAINGTGANVLALSAMLDRAEAVLCSDWAHINVDETGAPERVLGTKLIALPSLDGRVSVEGVVEACGA
ncbi:MAG: beta-eliminating lyase-related protein, partial [Ilumatobacter sp.]